MIKLSELHFIKMVIKSQKELIDLSGDGSYQIVAQLDKCIVSVLDLAISKSVKAMAIVEKTYGKNITTRNWKTIERLIKKL